VIRSAPSDEQTYGAGAPWVHTSCIFCCFEKKLAIEADDGQRSARPPIARTLPRPSEFLQLQLLARAHFEIAPKTDIVWPEHTTVTSNHSRNEQGERSKQ
jgi:hypothetical protein